jgi:hypothetical protein
VTRRSWITQIAWASLTFVPAAAGAQSYEGARLLGLAEAQRALTTGNDSIYVNPAGLALGQTYSVELGWLDDARGSDRRLNGSIIDSQAGPIAGGLAYTYTNRRPDDVSSGDERLEGHRVELSLATLVTEGAAIGITARYLNFNRTLGEQDIEGGFSQFTLDFGIQWRVVAGLSVGVVGYNLTNPTETETPISWGAGLGYAFDALSLEADVRYNAQKGNPLWSGGAGYVIANLIPIRAGISYDRESEDLSLSAGIGVVYERFSLDLGYRQRINGERVAEDDDARILGAAIRGAFF